MSNQREAGPRIWLSQKAVLAPFYISLNKGWQVVALLDDISNDLDELVG